MIQVRLLTCALLVAFWGSSCDKDGNNPVDPGILDEFGSVVVTVTDENENPIEGVTINIVRRNRDVAAEISKTDAKGIARFDSLTPGRYGVYSSLNGMIDEKRINEFNVGVAVSGGEVVPVMFCYPVVNSDCEFGALEVRIFDENENPRAGVEVSIPILVDSLNVPVIKTTNAEGIARYDSLPHGRYSISLILDNREYTRWFLSSSTTVFAGHTATNNLYFPVGPADIDVQVTLQGNVDTTAEDVDVYFPDWNRTISLDSIGDGILTDIILEKDMRNVHAVITRNNVSTSANIFVNISSNGWPYIQITCSSPPVVEITSPQNDTMFNGNKARLTCTGYDIEDGYLPDESLVWTSDRDGEIGTGRDITPTLSIGEHEITLVGEDSEERISSTSIDISVFHFSEQSYFPVPFDGVWKYRHDTPELIVTTDTGSTEHWTLEDMTVTSHDITFRTCRMDWTIGSEGEQLAYRYTLTDNLEIDEQTFRVTSTDELLSIYDGGDIVRELAVETDYTPSYPLLVDYLDPQSGTQEDITVTAESVLEYTVTDLGVHTMENTESVTVSYETGSPENVKTVAGTYATIPYTSTCNGVERTWWLAKGIGIVQMEYDLFGETVTALLYETNMEDYAGGVGKLAANRGISAPIRIQLDSSTDDAGRMSEIMDVMRGMCPR